MDLKCPHPAVHSRLLMIRIILRNGILGGMGLTDVLSQTSQKRVRVLDGSA